MGDRKERQHSQDGPRGVGGAHGGLSRFQKGVTPMRPTREEPNVRDRRQYEPRCGTEFDPLVELLQEGSRNDGKEGWNGETLKGKGNGKGKFLSCEGKTQRNHTITQ